MCLNWADFAKSVSLCCDLSPTASASQSYSSLRTSSTHPDLGTRQELYSPLHVILHSFWACFQYKAHIEGLVWHCSCDRQLKELKFKVFVSSFWACPGCGSQIHVRKLACLCGHVFHGSKWLTTRNASRKSDVSAARALEIKEQAAKRRKTNRKHVVGIRALETKEQTAKRRKSNAWSILHMYVQAWSVLLQYVCTGMVHIQDYQGVSHRFPTHYIREGPVQLCVVSASYLVYHHTAWIFFTYLAMSCDSVLILRAEG